MKTTNQQEFAIKVMVNPKTEFKNFQTDNQRSTENDMVTSRYVQLAQKYSMIEAPKPLSAMHYTSLQGNSNLPPQESYLNTQNVYLCLRKNSYLMMGIEVDERSNQRFVSEVGSNYTHHYTNGFRIKRNYFDSIKDLERSNDKIFYIWYNNNN